MSEEELIKVEDAVWMLVVPTRLPVYDFDFCRFFICRHPWQRPERLTAIARVGTYEDYETSYHRLQGEGIELIHSPQEHVRASELPAWYPLLVDLTPKSVWFDGVPDASEVAAILRWPIFIKGHRQTSRHLRSLAIVSRPSDFDKAMQGFRDDPILRWQRIVCREYVPLRYVEDPLPDRIPSSFEFRTFWWRGELVGIGRYWWEGKSYDMTETERVAALAVAREAVARVNVPFLVVDVAQTDHGRWIVIECNDGQESGYAGVPPVAMWRNVIEFERNRLRHV